MNINPLVRNNVKTFKPYQPTPTLRQISKETCIPQEKIIKLDSGENPYMEKYQKKNLSQKLSFYTYPDPFANTLREKIGDYVGVDKKWIACGNGSDELIDLLTRVFVQKNDEVIINPPTFPMYEFYGNLQEAKIIQVKRKKNLYVDEEGILNALTKKTKIVWIDTPGNPTSTVTSNQTIERILKKNIIVVSDEAYFEYCNKSALPLLKKYPNLVILRTFSKWAGLAGLRVGYTLANPEIISLITAIKAPYNVNSVAQEMACQVLNKRNIFLKEIEKLVYERKKIIKQLKQFKKIQTYPSDGAYIIFKPQAEAEKLKIYLKSNGLLVKRINQPILKDCIRINLMKEKEGELFIKLLRRFYE